MSIRPRSRAARRARPTLLGTIDLFRRPGHARSGLSQVQLALHWMQSPDQHDAHVGKVGMAITERSRPGGFVLRETFPDLGWMSGSNTSRQQKIDDCFRHEIPGARNDDRVPIVLQRM